MAIQAHSTSRFDVSVPSGMRLGMLVERFVFHEISQTTNLAILGANIQINRNGITLGEIDCILKTPNEIIHLEIVYKFYLYDPNKGVKEIEHWIGPNRKDSLEEKLIKLKTRQLPLLHRPETSLTLEKLNIPSDHAIQRVHFKAQLFTPISLEKEQFENVNNACISGCYLKLEQLIIFKECKFFVPEKADWLCDPFAQLNWLNYDQIHSEITQLHSQKRSPLCWVKHPNGTFEKLFVVWW